MAPSGALAVLHRRLPSSRRPPLPLSLPSSEWTVTGTPTQAGTYPFTVQFTPTENNPFGQGPPGTQQLTIAIGTGSSDRLTPIAASYSRHQNRLYVYAYDVNTSALYSVYKTSTGQLVIAAQPNNSSWHDGILALAAYVNDPCGDLNSCSLTVKDSLGSSVTLTLPPAPY
jgi:hypothetical protein